MIVNLPDCVKAAVGPVVVSEAKRGRYVGACHGRPGVQAPIGRIVKSAVADLVVINTPFAAIIDVFHEGAEQIRRHGYAG